VKRGRAALLLVIAASCVAGPFASPAAAAPRPGVVVLFLVDRVSVDDLMQANEFRQLGRAGGLGLMTTNVGDGGDPYATVGGGAVAPDGGTAGLMVSTLAGNGIRTCFLGGSSSVGTPDRSGLRAIDGGRRLGCDLGEVTRPALARPGGLQTDVLRLPASFGLEDRGVLVVDAGDTARVDREAPYTEPRARAAAVRNAVMTDGDMLRSILQALGAVKALVLVVSPSPSFAMDQVGDEVTPLLMAEGRSDRLLSARGAMRALTSDSTRHHGLVSNVDVAPTALRFLGVGVPPKMGGLPIRVTNDGAPFALHQRHLEQRRIRIPIQVAAIVYVCVTGFAAIAALFLMARGSALAPWFDRSLRFLLLGAVALVLTLLAGGLLPRLTYPVVVPFVTLASASLAWLALASRWRAPLGPFGFMGAVGVAFFLIDGALGGRAFRIPLLGATMFDGVRFYGLPNAFIATLLASTMFVAAGMATFPGTVLLFGAGLYAGLPALGADVGGAITLFVAAGLWWVARTRSGDRWRLRDLALVVGIAAAGLAIVLLANRLLPGPPTHATRFVERTGHGLGLVADTLRHRFGVAVRLIDRVPAVWIPLIGLPVVLALVLWRRGPVSRGLRRERAWRDVLVVLVLASIAAFFVNDTGSSAAAPAFLYAMAGMTYAALSAHLPRSAGVTDAQPRRSPGE
jgi:hypothetical protein